MDELKAKDYALSSRRPGGRSTTTSCSFPSKGLPAHAGRRSHALQVAKDNNVLIVSQMTLVIVLNMIRMAWKQADQEKNIADVYKTAEELMSQLSGLMGAYVNLGNHLEKAQAPTNPPGNFGIRTKASSRRSRNWRTLGFRPRNPRPGSRPPAVSPARNPSFRPI